MKLRNKKTGEIKYLLFNSYPVSGDIALEYMDENAESGYSEYCRYSSLAELNEDWEDYEPKEPLIKDEKIRKAVRAWAEALDADEVIYNSCAEYSEGRFEAEMGMADIDFGRVIGLKDGNYTITELCGEEGK